METLAMTIQFLLGLSIIVGLHELGHLLFAKLFGMRVETYTIGFSPNIFQFKWGETEYALGLLPLGGAVKIAGMVDEGVDNPELSSVPQPWEFRAKPAWQRLVVILGGVFFNVITGIIIFIACSNMATLRFACSSNIPSGVMGNALPIVDRHFSCRSAKLFMLISNQAGRTDCMPSP